MNKFWYIALFILLLSAVLFFLLVFPNQLKLANQLPNALSLQNQAHGVHYVKLQSISPQIQEAAIASQDKRFYTNLGIDIIGTFRAIFMTALTGKRQGASTIPEQLAKNVYFHDEDSLITDIKTKLLAPFITVLYPKKTILEMYLNDIYFGKNAYGIYNAAKTYFKTTPDHISLAKASYIMGLINAPSYFATHNKEAITQAQLVLGEMMRDNYITASEEASAENEQTFFK